jgi:hypothetical protein
MSRRVPELALVTGLLLALPAFGFGAVFGDDLALTALLSATVLYPFAGYAVYHSDDPTSVLPPRVVAAVGTLAGVATGVAALLGAGPGRLLAAALFAVFCLVAVALPPVAYAVVHDPDVLPLSPRAVLFAGAALAVAVLPLGAVAREPLLAAVTAGVVFLAAGFHAARAGVDVAGRLGRPLVAGGLLVGLLLAAGGVLVGPLEVWVVEAVAVPLTVSLFYVVSLEQASGRGRRR